MSTMRHDDTTTTEHPVLGSPARRLLTHSAVRNGLAAATVTAVGLLAVYTVDDFTVGSVAMLTAYACVAMGLTVLIGGNGQISLGHAALMAVGAYTMALFLEPRTTALREVPVLSVALALVLAVLVTLCVGLLIGLAAARLRGPYLAGATLSFGVAVPGLVTYFDHWFNGEQGLPVPPPDMPTALDNALWLPDRFVALIGVVAVGVTFFVLANVKRSAVGRHWAAVRDDEIAAQLCGLSIPREQVTAFAVSAATAGLGGAVLALFLQGVNPHSFDLRLSLGVLAAVVIGGLGSLRGAIWGSALVVFLQKVLADMDVDENLPSASYGLLLIVVMLAAPGGIQGLLSRLGDRLPRRSTHHQGDN
ncbi:branched-chain amino acid ABC transporter permease [Nocardioides currus]|uniref:Branched-chain amino acid ABC transporter permease n=1 Tax=Nocardioides currus TaxID=2133958 RepID=A0A2R7YXJ3_9ACTN|nr:branched-chain amino acid ABC transporter permease [Nocardioides currus]